MASIAGVVGDGPLGVTQIAHPRRPQFAGEPRLVVEPLDRRQPVGALVLEGDEFALGAEGTAAALEQDVKAPLGDQAADQPHHGAGVRRAHQDGRPVVEVAGVVVGRFQRDAVGHRHLDRLGADVARLGGRKIAPAFEQSRQQPGGRFGPPHLTTVPR